MSDRSGLADEIEAMARLSINKMEDGERKEAAVMAHGVCDLLFRNLSEIIAALRQSKSPDRDAGEWVREAVLTIAPCAEPENRSDDEYSADPRIEIVARDIAKHGLGCDWSDLLELGVFCTDRNDVRGFAKAAINSISRLSQAADRTLPLSPEGNPS